MSHRTAAGTEFQIGDLVEVLADSDPQFIGKFGIVVGLAVLIEVDVRMLGEVHLRHYYADQIRHV